MKTYAQVLYVGLNSGISISNVHANDFLQVKDNRIGFSSGLTGLYGFKNHFRFGSQVNYEQRGFKSYLIFTDQNGNLTGRREPLLYNYDYLSVPIQIQYTFGQKIYGLVGLGLVPAFLMKANTKFPIFDDNLVVIGTQSTNLIHNVSRFDCAAFALVGVGMDIGEKLAVETSFRYEYGFTTLTNSHYFSWIKMHHVCMIPEISIQYSLTEKTKDGSNKTE
jgi:hypothetical protein